MQLGSSILHKLNQLVRINMFQDKFFPNVFSVNFMYTSPRRKVLPNYCNIYLFLSCLFVISNIPRFVNTYSGIWEENEIHLRNVSSTCSAY